MTQDQVNEILEEAEENGWTSEDLVYFTKYGYKYHYYEDCQALKNSNTVTSGALEEVVEGHHTDPCSFCVARAAKEGNSANDTIDSLQEAIENSVENAVEESSEELEKAG